MNNKKIIEKVLKPYGVIKDGRITRICIKKALTLKEQEILKKIDEWASKEDFPNIPELKKSIQEELK